MYFWQIECKGERYARQEYKYITETLDDRWLSRRSKFTVNKNKERIASSKFSVSKCLHGNVAIILSDLWFVSSVYLVGILWPLYFLTVDLYLLFISSVSCGHCIVWPSICSFSLTRRYPLPIIFSDLRFVTSVYLIGILWSLYCLYFFSVRFLITLFGIFKFLFVLFMKRKFKQWWSAIPPTSTKWI